MPHNKIITVFEHQALKVGQLEHFDEKVRMALEKYYGSGDKPYFSLIHNGVKFNQYVGILQVGKTTLEILPKADKVQEDKTHWRNLMIGMLKVTGEIEVHTTSNNNLKLQPNTILDLYFERFIKEVEWLLHSGLIKQYRKKTSNLNALKGNLLFAKNIQHNIVHAEKFYVSHTTYDLQHLIHHIIYKTIRVLSTINTNNLLKGRISALLLNFPEMPDIKVGETTFERIVFTRKNKSYQNALSISKLLLLKLHPDIVNGKNDVLALMFDMNVLWEKFVFKSLRKHKQPNFSLKEQVNKYFWKSEADHTKVKMTPDIVIENTESNVNYVLDTKWKNLNDKNPSPEDLRQLYVYQKYFKAKHVALIYPGKESCKSGVFLDESGLNNRCSVICLEIPEGNHQIDQFQKQISKFIQHKITLDCTNEL